ANGTGWMGPYNRKVMSQPGSTPATVTTSDGQVFTYTRPTLGTTQYIPPAGAVNALKAGAAPVGWVETQPDGVQYQYDTNGKLTKVSTVTGTAVSLTLDANGNPHSVSNLSTASRRAVWAYDASNKIKRVVDVNS